MNKFGTKRLVFLALMVSQALILSIIESWIPIPSVVPGVKLGLANIITLVVVMSFGVKEAFLVVIVRCFLSSIFGGGLVVFLFSVTGGVLSTIVMVFLYSHLSRYFSVIGISVAGAVAHNIGQIIIACIVMKEFLIVTYLPILLVSGVIMGCFVGICSNFLVRFLKKMNLLTL